VHAIDLATGLEVWNFQNQVSGDTAVMEMAWGGDHLLLSARNFVRAFTVTNRAPDAVDDALSMFEDDSKSVTVLANDTDPDGDGLTVTAVTQGTHGTVTQGTHGTVTLNPNGTVNYVPNLNYNGTDMFTCTISDGRGRSDTAAVNVSITPVNDSPTGAEDYATVNEDSSVTIDVLANDTDIDGDALSFVRVVAVGNGTVVVNADSTVTFTPDPNYNGTGEFSYLLSD